MDWILFLITVFIAWCYIGHVLYIAHDYEENQVDEKKPFLFSLWLTCVLFWPIVLMYTVSAESSKVNSK